MNTVMKFSIAALLAALPVTAYGQTTNNDMNDRNRTMQRDANDRQVDRNNRNVDRSDYKHNKADYKKHDHKFGDMDAKAQVRLSKYIGKAVYNHQNEKIGDIEDLVMDGGYNRISYAVLSFGGFLGMGDKYFAIPWTALEHRQGQDDRLFLDVTEERLDNAPGFDKDNWPNTADSSFRDRVNVYYGVDSRDINNRRVSDRNIDRDNTRNDRSNLDNRTNRDLDNRDARNTTGTRDMGWGEGMNDRQGPAANATTNNSRIDTNRVDSADGNRLNTRQQVTGSTSRDADQRIDRNDRNDRNVNDRNLADRNDRTRPINNDQSLTNNNPSVNNRNINDRNITDRNMADRDLGDDRNLNDRNVNADRRINDNNRMASNDRPRANTQQDLTTHGERDLTASGDSRQAQGVHNNAVKENWDGKLAPGVDRQHMTGPTEDGLLWARRVSEVIDADVRSISNLEVGEIEDLIVEAHTGKVTYVVLDLEDDWRGEDRYTAIPIDRLNTHPRGEKEFIVGLGQNEIKRAPSFSNSQWPDFSDDTYRTRIDSLSSAQNMNERR